MKSIWIGFDPREADAFAVCRHSINYRSTEPIPVRGIVLATMKERGLYWRPTERRMLPSGGSQLWDVLSDAPMSTEFACSRFLTPHLAKEMFYKGRKAGWALFMDCDMLVRGNITQLFNSLDDKYAVYCVKHIHEPPPSIKMDNQLQVQYARKNWSSVMAFNCDHPANDALTLEMINTLPGRDLHRFCWLADEEIGELRQEWNWLAYHSSLDIDAQIVHFTEGIPSMPGYGDQKYAKEYWEELRRWAA